MAFNKASFYPSFGLNRLRLQLGGGWAGLIEQISKLPVSDTRVMAFSLTVRRIRRTQPTNHNTCRDSLCTLCAAEIVAQFTGGEGALLKLYEDNLRQIETSMLSMHARSVPMPVSLAAIA